jgi:hypothetical protein
MLNNRSAGVSLFILIIIFFSIINYHLSIPLQSGTEREGELASHRNGYTTCVEELGILTVEFAVRIDQEQVGTLQLQVE